MKEEKKQKSASEIALFVNLNTECSLRISHYIFEEGESKKKRFATMNLAIQPLFDYYYDY